MGGRRRLITYVEVDGTWYGPDDGDIPPNIADKIQNPRVWTTTAEQAAADEVAGRQVGTNSGGRLVTYVDVDGTMYGPEDYLPDRIAARIQNPKVWKGGRLPDLGGTEPADGDDPGPPDDGPDPGPPAPDDDDQPAAPAGAGRRVDRMCCHVGPPGLLSGAQSRPSLAMTVHLYTQSVKKL